MRWPGMLRKAEIMLLGFSSVHCRGLNNYLRVPLKGSFKGYYKGSIRVL